LIDEGKTVTVTVTMTAFVWWTATMHGFIMSEMDTTEDSPVLCVLLLGTSY
jgi:hypothetical protein